MQEPLLCTDLTVPLFPLTRSERASKPCRAPPPSQSGTPGFGLYILGYRVAYTLYLDIKLSYPNPHCFQECAECEGTIIFTGVGKSGFIAQKIAQTLVSTGSRSLFLSPTDALHGDIGIVGEGDLLVAFSKSGGSEELLKMLPFAKVDLAMPLRSHAINPKTAWLG